MNSKYEANEILTNARIDASAQKDQIINKAKEDAKEIIEESRAQALKQKEEILKEAKNEIVDVASKMASKMIEDNVDEAKYNEKALDNLE